MTTMRILLLLCLMGVGLDCRARILVAYPAQVQTDKQVIKLRDIAYITGASRALSDAISEVPILVIKGGETSAKIKKDAIRIRLDWAGVDMSNVRLEGPDSLLVHYVGKAAIVSRAPESKKSKNIARQIRSSKSQRVVITRRAIPAGQIISARDVAYATRADRSGQGLTDVAQVVGQAAVTSIARGAMVKRGALGSLDVVKGDKVNVTIRRAGFVIQGFGRAVEGGRKGDTIAVMNVKTRKTFNAVIEAAGLVEAVY